MAVAEAVLFDYGLTLVTFDFPRECLAEMLERFRPRLGSDPPSGVEIVQRVLLPIEESLPDLGEDEIDYLEFFAAGWRAAGWDLPRDLLYEILDWEQRCWDGAVSFSPGTFDVLRELRGRGLKLAVFSNAPFPPEFMHRQVRGNGLADAVDAIVFSSETGRRKPAPEAYLAALAPLGVEPAATLHVGDRYLEDFDGPTRLGMRAVLCTALARTAPPPGTPTIRSLAEVLDLL